MYLATKIKLSNKSKMFQRLFVSFRRVFASFIVQLMIFKKLDYNLISYSNAGFMISYWDMWGNILRQVWKFRLHRPKPQVEVQMGLQQSRMRWRWKSMEKDRLTPLTKLMCWRTRRFLTSSKSLRMRADTRVRWRINFLAHPLFFVTCALSCLATSQGQASSTTPRISHLLLKSSIYWAQYFLRSREWQIQASRRLSRMHCRNDSLERENTKLKSVSFNLPPQTEKS